MKQKDKKYYIEIETRQLKYLPFMFFFMINSLLLIFLISNQISSIEVVSLYDVFQELACRIYVLANVTASFVLMLLYFTDPKTEKIYVKRENIIIKEE